MDLRFRYKTFEMGRFDVHVRMLRDTCQYRDRKGVAEEMGICSAVWPIFGVVWPSGEILAHCMLDYDIGGKSVLEVGCGIALASLVLNHRSANITATDYHPETERFLNYNVMLNKGKKIPFVRTGWDDVVDALCSFDIIIGSDLLYERNHVELLSEFINRHAEKHCDVIIVDPGRGNQASFSKKMERLDFSYEQKDPPGNDYPSFKGKILHYFR